MNWSCDFFSKSQNPLIHIPPETTFALATQCEETGNKQNEIDMSNVMPTRKLAWFCITLPALCQVTQTLGLALVP